MPIALSEQTCKESVENLNQLLADTIGTDHAVCSPCCSAILRYFSAGPDHRESVAMSEEITRSLRNAAVPHAPMAGPIGNGVMSCL